MGVRLARAAAYGAILFLVCVMAYRLGRGADPADGPDLVCYETGPGMERCARPGP